MTYLIPSGDYRYAVKKGDIGTDVAALQMNLSRLKVDGVFGKRTRRRVKTWQSSHRLYPDGIAGVKTQQSIVEAKTKPITKSYGLPKGLLKSIASNESGFILSAAGKHLNDLGWDVGAFCRSSGSFYPDQQFLYSAYNVAQSAKWTARHVSDSRDSLPTPVNSWYFTNMGENNSNEFLWKLAILSHNWPAAAYNIAKIGTAMKTPGADLEDADWIIQATNGRLRTPREWCMSYVDRATVYVKWR